MARPPEHLVSLQISPSHLAGERQRGDIRQGRALAGDPSSLPGFTESSESCPLTLACWNGRTRAHAALGATRVSTDAASIHHVATVVAVTGEKETSPATLTAQDDSLYRDRNTDLLTPFSAYIPRALLCSV